ncbi:MAG TPA: hypothetical protein VET65_04870 [Candidatus Limnocylindrales bacterium]|nr:hypothetical protein [Candidatus Limnocylindrales bacterium]
MVQAPITVNWRGVEPLVQAHGRDRVKRAIRVALVILALAAVVVLLVGAYEDHLLGPAQPAVAAAQLPADLFTGPKTPAPNVIVRYTAPHSVAPAPAAPRAAGTARPASDEHHPSASPSAGGGDD